MIARNITSVIIEALSDTPVVFLRGARQTGKTTLVKELAKSSHPANYITLDSAGTLSAASSDPEGFIRGLDKPVIIDEVQRVPQLLSAIKQDVDRDWKPGRYILTGSSNVLTIPRVSESLAGRMEVVTLWPFSQGEIEGKKEKFIDILFSGKPHFQYAANSMQNLMRRITTGGYPEPVKRKEEKRRAAWFDSYLTTIVERDIKDLANIQDKSVVPRLLKFLAARVSTIRDQSEISRSAGIPNSSVVRHMSMLEMVFLIQTLPAWTANLSKRVIKSPRLLFTDTGLASFLAGLNSDHLERNHTLAGNLFENFIGSELRKQATWCQSRTSLYHFRTRTGQEVDLILEDRAGNFCGIEVKLSATAAAKHFDALKFLQKDVGERFVAGITLYTGDQIIPFGKNLFAVPVSAIWLT
jgi:predicted AAA+ superfamily ATPase